jgi:LTXXQ motif family protein
LARLDAADQRLVVMNYAATSMEVALNDLYASLDAGQKAKFTSLGR